MKPSGFYDKVLGAYEPWRILVHGDYFKIMAASSPVDVKSPSGELKGLIAGQGLENTPFSYLTIKNTAGTSNTVRVFIGDEAFIDGVSGAIAISQNIAARTNFVHTVATVTPTAANAVSAATRDYLMVQNKDSTGYVWVCFGGAATTANGLRLAPGDAWESGIACPQGAVSIIGDIASNANVLIVQG